MTPEEIRERVDTLTALEPRWRAWRLIEKDVGRPRAYRAYLRSDEWRARRDTVLKRAGGRCEACLERDACQVHHTTYRYIYNEPLFDLVAICDPCHEAITAIDNYEGRNR